MKIIKKAFEWARPLTPLNLSSVSGIALHHMAHATAGMDLIHQWHLARGWKGFAYNYWIDFEGNVYECRGLNSGGGLFDPLNDTVLSVGFQGDYNTSKVMPKDQYDAGVDLIRHLKQQIPSIDVVHGHKHWQDNTSCPGKFFPLSEMITDSNKVDYDDLPIKDFEQVASWAKEPVKKVVRAGIMIGDSHGYFKPTELITRQEVAVVIDRLLNFTKAKT